MPVLVTLLPFLTKLLGRFIPDPAAAQQAQLAMLKDVSDGNLADLDAQLKIVLAGAGVIQAEVASKSWLAVNWRPITMLVFVCLIVARMLGYTAPNITPAEYMELWGLMKLGLGGYIGGRTVEKVAPSIVAAIKGKQ